MQVPQKIDNAIYKASINHSEKSILRFVKVQYNIYRVKIRLVCILIGVALILLPLITHLNIVCNISSIVFGVFFFLASGSPPQFIADQMLRGMNGKLPICFYYFCEEKIEITDGKQWLSLPYTKVERFIEDKEYWFFFLNKTTGYVIDKKKFDPEEIGKVRTFFEQKTGLIAEQQTSLMRFNLASIIVLIKNWHARQKRAKPENSSSDISSSK